MANGQYIGVNGVARKVTAPYIGVNAVARKVTTGYVGMDGVARQFLAQTPDTPAILQVKKTISNTYANSTTYNNEEFIRLNIYPKSAGSTVTVTYGDLTKTLVFSGTSAQAVYFGTFNGVTDSVATPSNGTLIIAGDYRAYGCGSFTTTSKGATAYSSCITAIDDIGCVDYIPSYAFYNCTNITITELPSGITSIGSYAFYNCTNITITELPSGITSIGDRAFMGCENINISTFPEGITSIGAGAFAMDGYNYTFKTPMYLGTIILPASIQSIGNYAFASKTSIGSSQSHIGYLSKIIIRATTPPSIVWDSTSYSGSFGSVHINLKSITVVVPVGCGEAYRTAEGWSSSVDLTIVEAT